MRALFVHSHVFLYDKQGQAYSEGKLTYNTWQRYLKHFDHLTVAGRGKEVSDASSLDISSGENITHVKLPNTSTIKSRLNAKKENKKILTKLIQESDILIARMPSGHASTAISIAKKLNKPYAIELVGDVFSSLWFHGSIYGKMFAPLWYLKVKSVLEDSPHTLYVTKNYLQSRYPSLANANIIDCSNVELYIEDKAIVERLSKIEKQEKKVVIGLIGSYSSKYKGIDNALNVIKRISDDGYRVELRILGSGDTQWIQQLKRKLNLTNQVTLSGSVKAGKAVFSWLDNIDIYIQPSLTEGLPRALIEAMSRGCPCVGSNVGGIPELLDRDFIHEPREEEKLYKVLMNLIGSKELQKQQAIRNFELSKNYSAEVLNKKRDLFWSKVIKDIQGGK